jgi:Tfp pilus assembly protein PilN
VLVTQVEQHAVDDIVSKTEKWLSQQQPSHIQAKPTTVRVETRARAIARLWKADTPATEDSGTVGFLIIGTSDYAVALWSLETGLVYETEEQFERGAGAEIKCQHAHDMFTKFVDSQSLSMLRLPPLKTVVVSATETYSDLILGLLRKSEDMTGVQIEPISLSIGSDPNDASPLDQPTALAIGALLDDRELPNCNLTLSPKARLEEIKLARLESERAVVRKKARSAAVVMAAPIVAVLAFTVACWMDYSVEAVQLRAKIENETQIATQLQQADADYESSKANFGTFRTLLDNLITLRQRQPATHQLLSDLNARWPQDPTWYISEINVKGGNVELRGKTKNEQAITSFAKSLEFSNGLFSGILTSNNVQGAVTGQSTPAAPQSSVIEFTVRATYAPLATPGKPVIPPQQPQIARAAQTSATVNTPVTNPALPLPSGSLPGLAPGRVMPPTAPNIPLPQPPPGAKQ